jgi:hypothetical protein
MLALAAPAAFQSPQLPLASTLNHPTKGQMPSFHLSHPLATGVERRLCLALLALWAVCAIIWQWGEWAQDLSALYVAGHLWATGATGLIYAAPPDFFGGAAVEWDATLAHLGIAEKITFPYVYAPLWAAALAPVTQILSPQGFGNAVTLFQMPMLAASVLLAGRILRPASMPLWLWCLVGVAILSLSVPSYSAIWQNQPTITTTFLVLLAVDRLGAGRSVAAGIALACAAALKLSPAAFVLVFLIDRQWRALIAFVVAGAALGGLSIALAGWPLHQVFLDRVAAISSVDLLSPVNASLRPAILSLAAEFGFRPWLDPAERNIILTNPPSWLGLMMSFGLAAVLLAFAAALARRDGATRRGFALLALAIALPLFSPLGWQHYYVIPCLLLPGFLARLPQRQIALLGLVIFPPTTWVVFAQIDFLPWPTANYTWWTTLAWLTMLLALLHFSFRQRAAT